MFEQYYRDEFGFTSSNISWIGGLQLFLQFFLGAPSGIAFDFGYFRQLTIAGTIFYLLCVDARVVDLTRAAASSRSQSPRRTRKLSSLRVRRPSCLPLLTFARRLHGTGNWTRTLTLGGCLLTL